MVDNESNKGTFGLYTVTMIGGDKLQIGLGGGIYDGPRSATSRLRPKHNTLLENVGKNVVQTFGTHTLNMRDVSRITAHGIQFSERTITGSRVGEIVAKITTNPPKSRTVIETTDVVKSVSFDSSKSIPIYSDSYSLTDDDYLVIMYVNNSLVAFSFGKDDRYTAEFVTHGDRRVMSSVYTIKKEKKTFFLTNN